ncbi:hypothetical protein F5Y13DRAFT_186320 [Hypoxylon sp. FL1857]|nr:hypothetical protein F5Y13DRAFT_186320 [Hypoxylon sp. FL1857]
MPNSTFYTFTTTVATTIGVSSFDVQIKDRNTNTTSTNSDQGFPMLEFTGTRSNNTLKITAAVRDDMESDTVQLAVPKPINMIGTLSARFEPTVVNMEKAQTLNGTGYSLYKGSFSFMVDSIGPMKTFDLVASGPKGTAQNNFTRWAESGLRR